MSSHIVIILAWRGHHLNFGKFYKQLPNGKPFYDVGWKNFEFNFDNKVSTSIESNK